MLHHIVCRYLQFYTAFVRFTFSRLHTTLHGCRPRGSRAEVRLRRERGLSLSDLSSRVALERQTRPLRYAVRKQKSKTKVKALRNPILHKRIAQILRASRTPARVRSGTAALRRRHLPASTTHRHPTAIQQSHRCAPLRTARHGRRSAQRGSSSATPLALLSDVRATQP